MVDVYHLLEEWTRLLQAAGRVGLALSFGAVTKTRFGPMLTKTQIHHFLCRKTEMMFHLDLRSYRALFIAHRNQAHWRLPTYKGRQPWHQHVGAQQGCTFFSRAILLRCELKIGAGIANKCGVYLLFGSNTCVYGNFEGSVLERSPRYAMLLNRLSPASRAHDGAAIN